MSSKEEECPFDVVEAQECPTYVVKELEMSVLCRQRVWKGRAVNWGRIKIIKEELNAGVFFVFCGTFVDRCPFYVVKELGMQIVRNVCFMSSKNVNVRFMSAKMYA